MAKFKFSNPKQVELLPIDFTKQLVPGTIEHTINYLLDEKVDLSDFESAFKNDLTGAPAYLN